MKGVIVEAEMAVLGISLSRLTQWFLWRRDVGVSCVRGQGSMATGDIINGARRSYPIKKSLKLCTPPWKSGKGDLVVYLG